MMVQSVVMERSLLVRDDGHIDGDGDHDYDVEDHTSDDDRMMMGW